MKDKPRLNRSLGDMGLNELLSEINSSAKAETSGNDSQLNYLPLHAIQAGKYQPRKEFDKEALQELAESISAQGVIQPIVVRSVTNNRYEIIAGERRFRAAQLAGLQEIPAVIRKVSDEAAVAMALIENIQREDLNVVEEATALQRLIEEFTMTHEQVAEAVGKSRASVSNMLRILQLNEDVRIMVEHGDLDFGHAKVLLSLEGFMQSQAARTIVAKDLSVRETEKLVQKMKGPNKSQTTHKAIDPDIIRFQTDLSDRLGARVTIDHGPKGKGKLVIEYHSLDELDGILSHIK